MSDTGNEEFVVDAISQVLNLQEPLNVVQVKQQQIEKKIVEKVVLRESGPLENPDKVLQNDLDIARDNLKEMIEMNRQALESLMDLAIASENPRAFESASMLIKTGIEASEQLVQLHKTKSETVRTQKLTNEIGANPEAPKAQNITNQAVFVGSTKELLDIMGDKRNQKALPQSSTKKE